MRVTIFGTGYVGLVTGTCLAEVGNEAKRAGVSVQAFQEWKYVAEQSRIAVDSLVDGLKELNDADFENLGMPPRVSGPRDFAFRRYRR